MNTCWGNGWPCDSLGTCMKLFLKYTINRREIARLRLRYVYSTCFNVANCSPKLYQCELSVSIVQHCHQQLIGHSMFIAFWAVSFVSWQFCFAVFLLICLYFSYWFLGVLYIFWIPNLYQLYVLHISSTDLMCIFFLLRHLPDVLNFNWIKYINLFLYDEYFSLLFKKSVPTWRS